MRSRERPRSLPSPVRPAGKILSPPEINLNEGGTTISLRPMQKIHGPVKTEDGNIITCVHWDAGCTLRELLPFAHSQDLELPFSAEIDLSTVGGTAMAVTKDSPIGRTNTARDWATSAAFTNCGWAVEDDGGVHEYCVRDNETGKFDPGLFDSYGARGIVVRLWIVTRPQIPLTRTLHIFSLHRADLPERLQTLRKKAAASNGNIFCSFGIQTNMRIVKERIFYENEKTVGSNILCPGPIFLLVPCSVASLYRSFLAAHCEIYFPSGDPHHEILSIKSSTR